MFCVTIANLLISESEAGSRNQVEELSEVNCCLGCFLKGGEGPSEAISWKSKLVRQLAEVN